MPGALDALSGLGPLEASGPLLTDLVETTLRAAILSGTLRPGTRLSVPALARQLATSRTPAREALFRLERDGLVDVTPRRGAVVLRGGRSDLEQLFELREPLEGMAARLAALRMTEKERLALEKLVDKHRGIVAGKDVREHVAADLRFHVCVRDGAHNPRLGDALERLEQQIRLVMVAGASRPGGMPAAVISEHGAILDGILGRRPDDAERAARRHIRAVGRLLSDLLFG